MVYVTYMMYVSYPVPGHTLFHDTPSIRTHPLSWYTQYQDTPSFMIHPVSGHTLFHDTLSIRTHPLSWKYCHTQSQDSVRIILLRPVSGHTIIYDNIVTPSVRTHPPLCNNVRTHPPLCNNATPSVRTHPLLVEPRRDLRDYCFDISRDFWCSGWCKMFLIEIPIRSFVPLWRKTYHLCVTWLRLKHTISACFLKSSMLCHLISKWIYPYWLDLY